jgi:restriction endonuclease S subunit
MTDLPQGWREVALGEVCEYIRGVTYGKSDATDKPTEGFLPLLRATNIDDGRLVLSDFVFVPKSKVKPVQMLLSGDLVMAASSGSIQVVGKSAPVPSDFVGTFGAFCAALRPKDDTSHQFLNFFISSPKVREAWSAAARGTNINNLKREPVLGTQIPLPPLAEQERIVEILEEQFSRLDSALASVKAVREKAKAFRRSLLHSAFSGELTGGTEGWREVALGEVADVGWGDLSITKKSYVQEGYTAFSATGPDGKLPHFDYDQTGIVVSAIGAQCGKVFLATGRWSCIKNTMRILPSSDDASIKYLFQLLNTDFLPKRGSGQPFIGQKDAREALVALPPLAEQERIVSLLEEQFSRLDKALEVANQLEARIASERRSLLHSAFTGALTATWRQNND